MIGGSLQFSSAFAFASRRAATRANGLLHRHVSYSRATSIVSRRQASIAQVSPNRSASMSAHSNVEEILNNIAKSPAPRMHRAAIALGSNMGDRVGYIEQALLEMKAQGLNVLSISRLYQTKAMYYENQDAFINGACYIETELDPHQLLDVLQGIENTSGRVRSIDKGPRTLDLDILLYDEEYIISERLEVPHKLMLEREFVLRPLSDILPDYTFPISFGSKNGTPRSVSSSLHEIRDVIQPMLPVTILKPQMDLLVTDDPSRQTLIMSILNITPDSFSDGGKLSENDLGNVKQVVRQHIADGATILDIGGQSTRPKADLLTATEELRRILPVLEAIKSMPEAEHVAISIDTFYAQVVRETVELGADIINDVSGGMIDPGMLTTVAETGKTIVLMHMRGNPQTMNQLTQYPTGVVNGVASELVERVKAARDAGIHPWRIILDPGIGFAKTQAQNLELLRHLDVLRAHPEFSGMPWLLGVSRKGFIGRITGVSDAKQRVWGTAAAITTSIAGGVDIVRVHDVPEMTQLATMADAIHRQPRETESKKQR